MRLLLDTHALIWAFGETERIAPATLDAMATAQAVLVSVVSVYEMNLKHALGKLPEVEVLLPALSGYLDQVGFDVLPITLPHAELAGRLPMFHRDPFDRLLVAQALAENLTLVSNEALFDRFGVRRLW